MAVQQAEQWRGTQRLRCFPASVNADLAAELEGKLIRQVLLNLVANAVEFTGCGAGRTRRWIIP